MGTYIDDERQSLQRLGPRQQGWPANTPSAASQRLNGSTGPGFRRWLLAVGAFATNQS